MSFQIDSKMCENEIKMLHETTHPFISFHVPKEKTKWKVNTSNPLQNAFNQKVDFMCEGLFQPSKWHWTSLDLSLGKDKGGENILCGTITNPDTEKLIQFATPSKFGKGTETLYDENVRKGLEILPHQLTIRGIGVDRIRRELERNLFKTGYGSVSLNFSKMAIYQTGGHFDIHRDHVRCPDHQGTLLVEIRSEHTGGDLVITHQGMEYRWSLSDSLPASTLDGSFSLRYVAFYTDVMHRVDPVTSGVRIVLQYDILVSSDPPKSVLKASVYQQSRSWDVSETNYFPSPITNTLTVILSETLRRLISDHSQGVAVPLLHLYTDSQLTPNRLKAKDMELFLFLLQEGYCVQLTPILITKKVDHREPEDNEEDYDPIVYSVCEASVLGRIGYSLNQQPADEGAVTVKACPVIDKFSQVTYLSTGYEQAMLLREDQEGHTRNEADSTKSQYLCGAFLLTTPEGHLVKRNEEEV